MSGAPEGLVGLGVDGEDRRTLVRGERRPPWGLAVVGGTDEVEVVF